MIQNHPEVSVIVTVLNEAETITELLESLTSQTIAPKEICIVDGGSHDATATIVCEFQKKHRKPKIIFLTKSGNRSVGRNFAIENISTELVACTDAGCIPNKNWLEQLVDCYEKTNAPVIAGFYNGEYTTSLQKAMIPYALVMPDAVDEKNFLPATRSMLFEKNTWKKVGQFDESLGDNEDYVFAKKIKNAQVPIAFARTAIVSWQPRKTIRDFYYMLYRFARGDVQAKIIRPKVLLLFFRYLIAFYMFGFYMYTKNTTIGIVLLVTVAFYILWAVYKNKRYVGNAWYYLPILQFTADAAVIHGSLAGLRLHLSKLQNNREDQYNGNRK